LFTADQLKDAKVLKAEMMESVVLENQGKQFLLHKLPIEAQVAPLYGITSLDVNHDGKKDLLLAGNNSWTRIKFGRYTADHGILLTGDGKYHFTCVPEVKSGLQIRGDVRSVATVKNREKMQIIVGINNSKALSLHVKN